MKLLMFNVREFWFRTHSKTVETMPDAEEEKLIDNALVVFINAEKEDETRAQSVLAKTIDNITWLARKVNRKRIVLHAFSHLSDNKSNVGYASGFISDLQRKLAEKGYEAITTPFGYFLEFRLHVLGESLAKVWKSL